MRFRFRASGTDSSTGYYYALYGNTSWTVNTVTATVASNSTDTNMGLVANASTRSMGALFVSSPKLAIATTWTENSVDGRTTDGAVYMGGGIHSPATAYDGITIFPASGTVTCTIRVYGYKNS
jgi:hypothetical protein